MTPILLILSPLSWSSFELVSDFVKDELWFRSDVLPEVIRALPRGSLPARIFPWTSGLVAPNWVKATRVGLSEWRHGDDQGV
jgi:hypothetical protein